MTHDCAVRAFLWHDRSPTGGGSWVRHLCGAASRSELGAVAKLRLDRVLHDVTESDDPEMLAFVSARPGVVFYEAASGPGIERFRPCDPTQGQADDDDPCVDPTHRIRLLIGAAVREDAPVRRHHRGFHNRHG